MKTQLGRNKYFTVKSNYSAQMPKAYYTVCTN